MLLSVPPDQAQFPHACSAAHLNRALGRPNQPYCCLGLLDYHLVETEVYTAELRPLEHVQGLGSWTGQQKEDVWALLLMGTMELHE
jgi:hypothetical protein